MSQDSQFGFGLNKMAINSYRINMGDILVSFSVTAAGCIPVLETVRGTLDGSKCNPYLPNRFSYHYQLDESSFIFRDQG